MFKRLWFWVLAVAAAASIWSRSSAAVPTTTSVVTYVCNGTGTTFSVPFKFFANGDLQVKRVLIAAPYTETALTISTDYSVTGAGAQTGGSVVLAAGSRCGVGYNLRIRRVVSLAQSTVLPSSGPFTPKAHENAFDRLAMGLQQLNDGVILGATDYTLPSGTAPDDVVVTATSTVVPRTLSNRFGDTLNVKDFGADNTGSADTRAAVAAALAVAHDGSTLYFPPGTYRIACGAVSWYGYQINTSGLTLRGDGAVIKPDYNCYWLNVAPSIRRLTVKGFRIVGTLQTDGNPLSANINQGKIAINNGSEDIEISDNQWEDMGVAVYFNGATRLNFHHNRLIRTVAGIQGGTPYGATDLRIEDNYFLGDVTNPSTYGSDDQIAIMGPVKRASISRNHIDKQGPTAKNQAHAILAMYDGGEMQDIQILDNEIVNVATSTLVVYSAAIELRASGGTLNGATIRGNTIRNCNTAISVEDASNVTITGNRIAGMIAVSPGNWGVGIRVAGAAPNAVITGNTIVGTESDGITVSTGGSPTIRGNELTSIGRYAVSVQNMANATVDSNRMDAVTGDPMVLVSTAGAFVAWNRVQGVVTTTTPILDPWGAVTNLGGGNVDPDVSKVSTQVYTQTSGAGLNIRDPTSPSGVNQRFTVVYRNATGGATTVTWAAIYKLATWGSVAAGYSRSITFRWDGTNWVEVSRTPADVPN